MTKKCKDCKQDITFDYMFNEDVCLDCVSEEDYDLDLFRDVDCVVQDV